MAEYKDFNYVTYILESEFELGYRLFLKLRDKAKDKREDRLFQMFLIDSQRGYEGTFEDYIKQNELQSKRITMTHDEVIEEEQRIVNKVENMKKGKKMRRRVIA